MIFVLKSGQELSGTLTELSKQHITLEQQNGKTITILLDSVSSWSVHQADMEIKAPEVQLPSTPDAADSPPPQNHDAENLLFEISTMFNARIKAARIPDFIAPHFEVSENEATGWRKAGVFTSWERAKNKFEYASKINELGTQYGRLQDIITEVKRIAVRFPQSTAAKRQLAYLLWLNRNETEAFEAQQQVVLLAPVAADWHNLAVLSLSRSNFEIACYALERYYLLGSPSDNDTWFVYVGLLHQLHDYSGLIALVNALFQKKTPEIGSLLLRSALFLLKESNETEAASASARSIVDNISSEAVLSLCLKELEKASSQTLEAARSRYRVAPLPPPTPIKQTPGSYRPTASSLPAKSVDRLFELARQDADRGDYNDANYKIREVLRLSPDYPQARELYEKWKEYARASGVPRGSNPFARAKRAQLVEKNLDQAIKFFQMAIMQGDRTESAVKDLAAIYSEQGRPQAAIDLLLKHRDSINNQQSVDNMLVGFFQRASNHEQAIQILETQLRGQKRGSPKWFQIASQIADNYSRQGNYRRAQEEYQKLLRLQPEHVGVKRNLALCLLKQDKLNEAEALVNQILQDSPDTKSVQLLESIQQAKKTGQTAPIIQSIMEAVQVISRSAFSPYAEFLLEQCKYQGVREDHFTKGETRVYDLRFADADIKDLVGRASDARTARPRDRAAYYLSAAKITFEKDDKTVSDDFFKFLGRSFASTGDAYLSEGRHIDAVRSLYVEALAVYDGYQTPKDRDEQDTVNAAVRYLFSILGVAYIPRDVNLPTLDDAIHKVITQCPSQEKAFTLVSYLIASSRYAENLIDRIYKKPELRERAIRFLKLLPSDKGLTLERFTNAWKELRRKYSEASLVIRDTMSVVRSAEFTTAVVEANIARMNDIVDAVPVELDQERLRQLLKIMEFILDLCRQETFDGQETLCTTVKFRLQELIQDIHTNPTKFAVEELVEVCNGLLQRTEDWLANLYETSVPSLILRLAIGSYSPNDFNQIAIQIVLENSKGRSPAEELQLVINEDTSLFELEDHDIRLGSSLRGGEQRIINVPIQLTAGAIASESFSLPIYAEYTTRTGDIARTQDYSFSIDLYSKDAFEEIPNPYAAYAEGGIVGDSKMFIGRGDLIKRITRTLEEAQAQSKCIVIYGQKRAGKSSILHHLKVELQSRAMLILDIGNIGQHLDDKSTVPLIYQVLWTILRKLEYAVEDKIDEGYPNLGLSFPQDVDFYAHPSPLSYFVDFFEQFRRKTGRVDSWRQLRTTVLIDEFSYIYALILQGRISTDFMKNWKAILQANFFNVILVGQDVMPKFKERFPNEFGTTQDEAISYLRQGDAIRLIDEPIRYGSELSESRYREKAIERILELTAGSPFYIQILCNRLVQHMNRERARLVTDANVEQVKLELISGVNALGIDKFDNLINSGDTSPDAITDEDTLEVLTSIALNSRTGPCSRSNIVCETKAPIDVILEDLVRRKVIDRERDNYYRIYVALFRDWLIIHRG